MKATIENILKGATLYYVSCINGKDAKNARLTCKIKVTSDVNTDNNIQAEWFLCEDDYRPFGYNWCNAKSHHFLADCGIGEKPYNLHRLFTSYKSALAYVEECKAGVFSDPLDQEFYDKTLTEPEDEEDELGLLLSLL